MVGCNLRDVVQENSKDEYKYVFLTRADVECEDRDSVMAYFMRERFDAVVHLAACVGGLYMNIGNNQEIYERNKRINDNVIDACRASDVKRGIFCSSSCVFPSDPPSFPMNEDMHLMSEPHASNRGYGNAKRDMYRRCKELNEKGDYNYLCLIPVNMYGKYDNFDIETGHFVPALMHRFEMAKQAVRDSSCENKYIAFGDGKPLRQLLYAPDFADIIYRFLLKENHSKWIHDSVIVCNNEEHTIKEVVRILADVMELDIDNVVWDTSKANGCMRKTVSNERLIMLHINTTLGVDIIPEQFTSIQQGLLATYAWFTKQYKDHSQSKNGLRREREHKM